MNDWIIETRDLTHRFGSKLALDHLDLRVPRGGIHAIVGSNGAGKSTLFRILLGLMRPTAGQALLLGEDSLSLAPRTRGRVGFVNEEHTLPGWMRVAQVIATQRALYPSWNQAVFDESLGNFSVEPTQFVKQLSRGERAGLNLSLALAQSPELLILDEPTLGLDVVAKRAFIETLLFIGADQDCTIIYCSHQMEEIERVADNLIIMERGAVQNISTPDDFRRRVRYWIAQFPDGGSGRDAIPGLLQARHIDGADHLVVLDCGDEFGEWLRRHGASDAHSVPVSLDQAINGFLARGHDRLHRKEHVG